MNFIIVLFLVAISEAKLIFVTVVHRHGDRTPEKVYPTDPYQEIFWKEGLGILTNLGKNQLYGLGTFTRTRYSGLLPIKYHDADVHVESSEIGRCLMSAYCSLASLYNPYGDDIWSTYVDHWQPVPVYVLPESQDNIILNQVPCPKLDRLQEEGLHTQLSEEAKGQLKEVLSKVSYFTGLNLNFSVEGVNRAAKVYDTLFVEESNNLKLPGWTTDFYPEPLKSVLSLAYLTLPYYNNEAKRVKCGPLLKNIIQNLDKKINGTIDEKFWQYSGHDTTVTSLLQCLGVFDGEQPDYAGAVFVELHQNEENQYEVVLLYRKNAIEVKNLVIPNCSLYCPLEKFKELTKDVIPDDWEKECKSD